MQVGPHSRTSPAPQLGVTGEQEENDGQWRMAEDRQIRFRVVPVRPRQSPSITSFRVGPATAPRDIGVATQDRQQIRGKDDELEDVFGSTCTPLHVQSRAQSKPRAKVSGVDVRERVGLTGCEHPRGHEVIEAIADHGNGWFGSSADPLPQGLDNAATRDRSAELAETSPAEGQFDDAEVDSPARLLLSFASAAYTYGAGPSTYSLCPTQTGARDPVPARPADAQRRPADSSTSTSTPIAEYTPAIQSCRSPAEHPEQPVRFSEKQSSTLQARAGSEAPVIGVSAEANRPEVAVMHEADDSQDHSCAKRRRLAPVTSPSSTMGDKLRIDAEPEARHEALDMPNTAASSGAGRPPVDDGKRGKEKAKATRLRHQACT